MRIDISNLQLPESEAVLLLKAEVRRLQVVIAALADQDATQSVGDGNVIVTMEAALTYAEREAVERAADLIHPCGDSATLRGLLGRMA